MNKAIDQFQINLQSAKQLGILYNAFSDKVTAAINLDEMLRAELVLAVSALDCYVHDIVKTGMLGAFFASQGEPNAFLGFAVSLRFVKNLTVSTTETEKRTLVDLEIRRLHGFKTFQTAENISTALALIGIQKLWEKVGVIIGKNATDTKTELNIIVDRRNRIAHEGDIDPTMGIGMKYAVNFAMVQGAINFLDSVAKGIHAVAIAETNFN